MEHAIHVESETWWLEFWVILSFCLGFLVLKGAKANARTYRASLKVSQLTADEARASLCRKIERDACGGETSEAVKVWRAANRYTPSPLSTLREVLQALLKHDSADAVQEVVDHIAMHATLQCPSVARAVIDVASGLGKTVAMKEFFHAFQTATPIPFTSEVQEALLTGYESNDDIDGIRDTLQNLRACGYKCTLRAHSIALRAFLARRLLEDAIAEAAQMHQRGFLVPDAAILGICQLACEDMPAERALAVFESGLRLHVDAVELMLQHFATDMNVELAQTLLRRTQSERIPLTLGSRVALSELGISHA